MTRLTDKERIALSRSGVLYRWTDKTKAEICTANGGLLVSTLRAQLNELFPEVLSSEPARAINGTDLLEKVRPRLTGDYAENSIRQHFSVMSQDPTSSIAKVTDGHGYYLRLNKDRADAQPSDQAAAGQATAEVAAPFGARDLQLEEKFRAIFIRHSELANQRFPMHVEHTRAARRESGVNQWKFPDVVLLGWEVGELTDQGFRLDPNLLAVKTSLGEPPFFLESVELKVDVSLPTFRENFFQCVSNSKWAHGALLAIANNITDKTLNDELRRLGASYDVSVVTYGLSSEFLQSLPSAVDILNMTAADFDGRVAGHISPVRISTGKERASLDWEHISDLRSLSPEFRWLFEWIAYCLSLRRAYSFPDFQQIQKIEQKTA
jgi:hypothetical protein